MRVTPLRHRGPHRLRLHLCDEAISIWGSVGMCGGGDETCTGGPSSQWCDAYLLICRGDIILITQKRPKLLTTRNRNRSVGRIRISRTHQLLLLTRIDTHRFSRFVSCHAPFLVCISAHGPPNVFSSLNHSAPERGSEAQPQFVLFSSSLTDMVEPSGFIAISHPLLSGSPTGPHFTP